MHRGETCDGALAPILYSPRSIPATGRFQSRNLYGKNILTLIPGCCRPGNSGWNFPEPVVPLMGHYLIKPGGRESISSDPAEEIETQETQSSQSDTCQRHREIPNQVSSRGNALNPMIQSPILKHLLLWKSTFISEDTMFDYCLSCFFPVLKSLMITARSYSSPSAV